MNPRKLTILAVLLPVLALAISAFTVSWETARLARLSGDLARTDQEIARLEKLRPSTATAKSVGHPGHHDNSNH